MFYTLQVLLDFIYMYYILSSIPKSMQNLDTLKDVDRDHLPFL